MSLENALVALGFTHDPSFAMWIRPFVSANVPSVRQAAVNAIGTRC
jgi:hypothetical protein